MRPGFLIVFFVVLAICGAIAQMLAPFLDVVREDSEVLYFIYAILSAAFVLIPPILAVCAWNRRAPK
jgi:hypothetical protein